MNNILKEGNSLDKTKLNLNSKGIDDEKIEIIIKYLTENPTITTLNLWGNKIGDIGAKYLSENSTITTLNLWKNKIGELGAKYLSENTTITTLTLWNNKIGEEGEKLIKLMPNKRKEYNEQIKELLLCKIHEDPILFEINDINNIVLEYIKMCPIRVNL